MSKPFDVIIIGAGAAGMMCAIEAGKRGRKVLILDHAKKLCEKIRISGGGRCNFTNVYTSPDNFLSQNKHFCKYALKEYTPHDFIVLVEKYNIAYHEKKLGQLFCDDSAQNIIDMLMRECAAAGVTVSKETTIDSVSHEDEHYKVKTNKGVFSSVSLVIATGGLSIPKIGASGFGYDIARQFGMNVLPTRAGLVPLTFTDNMLDRCKALSGLSVEASVSFGKTDFAEGFLFTHRGLSGPSILQISSYWQEGENIEVNLAPDEDMESFLKCQKNENPKQDIQNILAKTMPKKLAVSICEDQSLSGRIAEIGHKKLSELAMAVNRWRTKPNGTEGYRTAEVTLGGIDTNALDAKTMEAKNQKGLFFIGEVVDVTGHLGGFNFQWAWSSGYVAGQVV
jgi:hypothetical protein